MGEAPAVPLRRIVRRFWPYVRPYRLALAASLLAIVLAPIIEAAAIWAFKEVVDNVLVPADFGPLPVLAGLILALALVAGIVSYGDDVLASWLGGRFLLDLRADVYKHVMRLSPERLDRGRVGDLVARLTGDVSEIEHFVLSGPTGAAADILRIAVFGTAIAILDWRLALATLVALPAFALAARRFSRLLRDASRERRRRSGALSALAEEGISNAALVQAYGREDAEGERFRREGLGILSAQLSATRLRAIYTPVVELIEVAGGILVVAVGVWEIRSGRLSIGGLLAFLAFLGQLFDPVRGLGKLATSLYSAAAGAERVLELMDETPSVADRDDALDIGRARGEVSLERVGFAYTPGSPVLNEVDLRLAPGEMVALVGPSGAGKSTIMRLLLRFQDPTSGTVRLDGRDVRDVTLESLRRNAAVVLQETMLLDGTIRDNILYGRPEATAVQVEKAARAAGAHEFIAEMPDGYETRVGQRGRRLSGGQRQRIAIARAFLRDAPILLLDEPTAALDRATADRLRGPLSRLAAGRATLIVSHDPEMLRDASRTVYLERGSIVAPPDADGAIGTHAQLVPTG